ncbi:MAG: hypothetical protein JXA04_04355 [Gammaproteobacteria bacterium]|nr:hypothetical protein [Gammaproteobacteria bacterium]
MNFQMFKFGLAEVVLLIVFSMSVLFGYWLIAENDDDKVHRILFEHDRLLLAGQRQEARALLIESLRKTGEEPLDPIWFPVVLIARGNGYEQLTYFERILAADPDREATYKAIANLIELAPSAFHAEVKSRYFASLVSVPGVRVEWLSKYKLLPE